MKRIPLGYRVLVKVLNEEKLSKGGIVITDYDEAKRYSSQEATIVAKGAIAFKEMGEDLPIGARVLVARHAGENFEDFKTGDLLRLLNDVDVLCRLDREKDDE